MSIKYTWNPGSAHVDIVFSNSDLTAAWGGSNTNLTGFAQFTLGYVNSVIYFEIGFNASGTAFLAGVKGERTTTQNWLGSSSYDIAINNSKGIYTGGSNQGTDTNLPNFNFSTMRVCGNVNTTNGRAWLGFVESDGTQNWHGGGDPSEDTTPSLINANWANSDELISPAVTPYNEPTEATIYTLESDFWGAIPTGSSAAQSSASGGSSNNTGLIPGANIETAFHLGA